MQVPQWDTGPSPGISQRLIVQACENKSFHMQFFDWWLGKLPAEVANLVAKWSGIGNTAGSISAHIPDMDQLSAD